MELFYHRRANCDTLKKEFLMHCDCFIRLSKGLLVLFVFIEMNAIEKEDKQNEMINLKNK